MFGVVSMNRNAVVLLWLLATCSAGNPSVTRAETLPAPGDVPEAVAGVKSPGGIGFPRIEGVPAAGAPAIAAISDVTFPDETLVTTGEGLDGAGLRVWAEGTTFHIEPLRALHNRMQAVIPKEAPHSTMLVWPVRDGKAGEPIRVNGATAWWAWPARIEAGSPGATVRVFGKNLRLPSDADPLLVLEESGGARERLDVSVSNPYHLGGELPHDLAPGTYRVRAHNGTGGVYGWSEAVEFEVVAPLKLPEAVFRVDDYLDAAEGSDRGAVLLAVAAAAENGGGTVKFAARHYRDLAGLSPARDTIVLPEGVLIVLRGAGMGDYDWHANCSNRLRSSTSRTAASHDPRRASGQTSSTMACLSVSRRIR